MLQATTARMMLVLTLKSGVVRSIFVEVPARLAPEAVARVGVVLNERLAGLTLRDIRGTLPERLRDATPDADSSELLNIFIQEADELFDMPTAGERRGGGVLGSAPPLPRPPEVATQKRVAGVLAGTPA